MRRKPSCPHRSFLFFSLLLAAMCALIPADLYLSKPLVALSRHLGGIRPVPPVLFVWSDVCDFYRAAATRFFSLFVPIWINSFSS